MRRSRGGHKRGGGEVRTLPINRTPSPTVASPQRLEGFADSVLPDPGSEVIIIHSHPARTRQSPWKYSPAVVWCGRCCLQPLAARAIINHLEETRLLNIGRSGNCWFSPIISFCVWAMLLPGGSPQPNIVSRCRFPAQLSD